MQGEVIYSIQREEGFRLRNSTPVQKGVGLTTTSYALYNVRTREWSKRVLGRRIPGDITGITMCNGCVSPEDTGPIVQFR